MKMRLIPEAMHLQQLREVWKNGSEAAQVKRLTNQMDREVELVKNPEKVINDNEAFPNEIPYSSSSMVRKLLNII